MIDEVTLEEVLQRIDDLVAIGEKMAARTPPDVKPPDIHVSPQMPAPEVKVDAHVTVPERKPESYRVHSIKRDENKLITSFEITPRNG